MVDRRTMLGWSLAAGTMAVPGVSLAAVSAATDRRLLMVVLRGAADGLGIAAPIGDPDYDRLRGAWQETHASAPRLDGLFALHPRLANFARFFNQGDALIGHALATSYRERSHFDAQNILETGSAIPFARDDGFLNRLLGMLRRKGDFPALALVPTLPTVLRGPQQVGSYTPSALPNATAEVVKRVSGLYGPDAELSRHWTSALRLQEAAGLSDEGDGARALGGLAARLMTGTEQARLVMIDLPGWDSHANQRHILEVGLGGLDNLLGDFRAGLGSAWGSTLIAVVTEFGRTVAINGTGGTDHGTGGVALLAGGAVRGRRVVTDWPGLAPAQLYQGRDLRPTIALEAFLAGAIAEHFALDPARTLTTLFPGRTGAAVSGLIA